MIAARSRLVTLLALVVIATTLAVGASARFWITSNDPLWLDELHTSWVVSGDWSQIGERAAQGHQSPFYFWFVKVIVGPLGQSEWALRIVSLLSGIGLMVASGCVCWHWFHSWPAAWLAVALVAADETCLFYSSEARPYALLQLVALLHCHWLAAWAWRGESTAPSIRSWFVLAIFASALVLIHPTAVILVAAQSLGLVALGLFKRNRWLVCAGLGNGAAAATAILVIPGSGATWSIRALWSEMSDAAALLNGHLLTMAELGVLLVAAGALLCTLRATGRKTTQAIWWIAASWLALFAVSCFLAVGGDITGWAPLAHERYTVAALVCGWIGLAGLLAAIPGTTTQWVTAIAVVVAVLMVPLPRWYGQQPVFQRDNYLVARMAENSIAGLQMRFEDWQSAVRYVNAVNAEAFAPVFLRPGLLEEQIPRQPRFDQFSHFDRQSLWQYLEFPVQGIYRLNNRQSVFLREENLVDAMLSRARTSSAAEQLRCVVIDRFGASSPEYDGPIEFIKSSLSDSLPEGRSLRIVQAKHTVKGPVVRVLLFYESHQNQ